MSNWGGNRKGSGRPKGTTKEKRHGKRVWLLPETETFLIDYKRRFGTYGKVVDFLVKNYKGL